MFVFSFTKVVRVCLHWEHLHNLLGEDWMTLRMRSVSWKICSSFCLVAIQFAWANPNVLHSRFLSELVLKISRNVMVSKRTSEVPRQDWDAKKPRILQKFLCGYTTDWPVLKPSMKGTTFHYCCTCQLDFSLDMAGAMTTRGTWRASVPNMSTQHARTLSPTKNNNNNNCFQCSVTVFSVSIYWLFYSSVMCRMSFHWPVTECVFSDL